ncbi:MAG: 3-hydroxyacyl-CoA dehydrogenase family protein, partial [Gemmatimonadales bacterium]
TIPLSPFPFPVRVAVVGAGTMGHGIAYVAALAGATVALTDTRADALATARKKLEDLFDGAVARGKLTPAERRAAAGRLREEPDLGAAVSGAGVVIEAVIEELAVKRRLLAELERLAPPGALLATNTSSLSIAGIAGAVRDPACVIGLHFFNPVHVMRLVEVVRHPASPPATVDRAVAFARSLGKEPIVVNDSPGFASSRLGVVLGLEAMRMVESGVATPEDIDKAMELGYNHPMGPLRLTDLVGLDVRLAIAEYLHHELKLPHYEPPKILRDKVARGELGKKTGRGFYSWGEEERGKGEG